MGIETLRIILGDQLSLDSPLFNEWHERDSLWMAEVIEESRHVPSHKTRSVYFLSAMRHFAETLKRSSYPLIYHALDEHDWTGLDEALAATLDDLRPQAVTVVQPGDMRVQQLIEGAAKHAGIPLTILDDSHFFSTPADFSHWAAKRKSLRMEYYYRELRKRYSVLMDGDKPAGGAWNFDAENRKAFPKTGPAGIPQPRTFTPDAITKKVIRCVNDHLPDNPGSTESFDWPVTKHQAEQALTDFIEHRLIGFGDYQDAMWIAEPWLYHSRLAAALNLKLLDPRSVVAAAEAAWRNGQVSINAAEGFIRQILGWREYIRGLYFHRYEAFSQGNALQAAQPLPEFFWTGDTSMVCLADTVKQTLNYGYAHHIQRLMVTGLFTLLLGVKPSEVHAWYLAVYVDAVEWVEMPNTIGMSQYADGGVTASKPYIASGKYIQRMSNYCDSCRYRPDKRIGAEACPFTVLYWDFLHKHRKRFNKHPRMALQTRNLDRIPETELTEIRNLAENIRQKVSSL
ncbi:cryptochrome/photolyase family protein [Litorivivens sp.]|uniref:cryptochrome/photolyase family protein n=1 Tax=Litorivivens sp. TaxID=2020868 RepID=UPI003564A81B